MPFLVVPNEVTQTSATVWVAAINENFDPTTLEYASRHGSNQVALNGGWSDFGTDDGSNRMRYQRVILPNLIQRTWYSLVLRANGNVLADGSVITLPDRLPTAGDRPFTVLLGSCYFGREDKTGAVGQTYLKLPPDAKPEIKILCGDQVYLDNPFQDFLNPFHGREWLQTRSFKTYADTWTQSTIDGGFGRMLKHEANFFASDDHEFWNNAPDKGLNVLVFTSTQGARDDWWAIARELYQVFQTSRTPPSEFKVDPSPHPPVIFKVDPLSFCIADTRFNRGHGGGNDTFMLSQDLTAIQNWIAGLDGPGVLVIGQPFFENIGSAKDYGLPDFRDQYEQLKQHLRQSQHTIVILTGDVHYGRLSVANLRPELGTKLYEVISSPMELVPHGGGPFHPAPQVFGAVSSQPEFSRERNHFLTLDFMAPSAQRASMLVRFWPIIKNGMPMQSQIIGGGPIELI